MGLSLALAACEPAPSTPPQPTPAPATPEPTPDPPTPSEPTPSEPTPPEPTPPEAPPAPADPLAALDAQTSESFRAGPEDAYFKTDTHYVKTNESRHDVWFPYIDGLGGAYLGVGADQNYTLIARARSRFVFLIDIDPRVGQTHRVYEVLIERAETPEALLAYFERSAEDETAALLEEAFASLDEGERKRLLRAYRASRETLRRHLARVATRTHDDQPSSWLSDPESYAWIRRLYLADRVRIMPGDLTGEQSMATVAAATRALGVPLRVVYMSNAEEYFKYFSGRFRANIRELPGDADSVVLRTLYGEKWKHADSLWNYQVQPWSDFAERLAREDLRSRNPMIADAESRGEFQRNAGEKGLSLLGPARPATARE